MAYGRVHARRGMRQARNASPEGVLQHRRDLGEVEVCAPLGQPLEVAVVLGQQRGGGRQGGHILRQWRAAAAERGGVLRD